MSALFANKSVGVWPQTIHVFTAGSFGIAVGRHLRVLCRELSNYEFQETRLEDGMGFAPESWPAAAVRIIAAWRMIPGLCELLDRECRKGQPFVFVPLILDSTVMQIGPAIVPHAGPCWPCWKKRYLQHLSSAESELALTDFYAKHQQAGPEGYLETFAAIGAARLAQIILALEKAPDRIAGSIWQIDMVTREITAAVLQGVHDCPQCGLARPVGDRTTADFEKELAYLWKVRNERASDRK